MNTRLLHIRPSIWLGVVFGVTLLAAGATWRHWLPWAKAQIAAWSTPSGSPEAPADPHAGHDHAHGAHEAKASIELSPNGLKNVGYRPLKIELGDFEKTTTLPAMVVERPGRSQLHITAPLTGVVTRIYPIQGAAVEPGSPMFELQLTHEELVTSQRDLLRTVESLNVVNRELARLKSLTEGIIPGKRILEQEYEKQKLEASLKAERQALLLHGLSEKQVEAIVSGRQLFQTLVVRAPEHNDEHEACHEDHLFHVQRLNVNPGQQVDAGQLLGVLADHCELYIEGRAFEDDAARLREAAREGWDISAALLVGRQQADVVGKLKLLRLSDHVDPESRVFRFYLQLPNKIVLDQTTPGGQRFIDWRFKPGQRMQLRVPTERWTDCIVVPVDAVVEEAAEVYVYQQNGKRFNRVPVHVEYRDETSVVIANDGAVYPGDIIAARGAYQMHLAIKNKAGGGVDPHAGHHH